MQLIVATGTHRPSSPSELERMLGAAVVRAYPVFHHDAGDLSTMRPLPGLVSGRRVWLNRRYLDARVRVLTGLVEPHFFAGFSGGPKAVLPGIADRESILSNHGAANLDHPGATWGVTEGNPVYEEMMRVALWSQPSFAVNVTTGPAGAITGVYAGSLPRVHSAAVRACRRAALRRVDGPFDVVVTSNSGYPLDLDLYQGIKGVSAAARIVRPGGAIVLAAECRDGIPDGSGYARLLRMADSPRSLLEIARSPQADREGAWQAHLQALSQMKARVFVHSRGLSASQIESAHLSPAVDLEATVSELLESYGPSARAAVLPEGPRTIPSLAPPGARACRARLSERAR